MYTLNKKARGLVPYDPIAGEYPVRLDANESFLPLPEKVVQDAQAALGALCFNRYPDPNAAELCKAFARRYGVPTQQVVAGNGSDELITLLFTTFLEKGDAFATVEPDFSMYAFNGFLQENRHVAIKKGPDYRLNIDDMIETCKREDVKLLIFSNPCNPTSLACPREEVRRLVRGVEALVVLDEAYMDFSDQSLLGEVGAYDNLLILRTCSKAFGMAALRLGFAVGGAVLTGALRAAKSPYNVNALSQQIGALALSQEGGSQAALRQILESKRELEQGLEGLLASHPGRFVLLPSATNFCSLVMEDGPALVEYLKGQGIIVRYTGGLVRITCGTAAENAALLGTMGDYLIT